MKTKTDKKHSDVVVGSTALLGSVLIWKPHASYAPPEPTATFSYGGLSYQIPYTILDLMARWVAIGTKGTHAPADAEYAARNMLETVAAHMRADARLPNAQAEGCGASGPDTSRGTQPHSL